MAEQSSIDSYLIGGSVRDLVLGRKNTDLDILLVSRTGVQDFPAIKFAGFLARKFHGKAEIFRQFGTATVTFPRGKAVDLVSARKETYARPAALPTVKPGTMVDDLFRRDFTINTLAICLNPGEFGRMVDRTGAMQDLKNRLIRILHPESFIDDPTRIFRALRYEQRFGFRLEKSTLAALKKGIHGIRLLSGTRVRNEFIRIFEEKNPLPVLNRLDKLGVMRVVSSGLKLNACARRYFKTGKGRNRTFDWLFLFDNLSVLQAKYICRKLQLDAETSAAVLAGKYPALQKLSPGKMKASHIFEILSGKPEQIILFWLAKAENQQAKCRLKYFIKRLRKIKLTVTGEDLKKAGLKPGPMYRKLLRQVLRAKFDGKVRTRAQELNLAYKLAYRGYYT